MGLWCHVVNLISPEHSITFSYFKRKDLWLSRKTPFRFRTLLQLIIYAGGFFCPENSQKVAFFSFFGNVLNFAQYRSPIIWWYVGALVHFIWKPILFIKFVDVLLQSIKKYSSDIGPNKIIYYIFGPGIFRDS